MGYFEKQTNKQTNGQTDRQTDRQVRDLSLHVVSRSGRTEVS